MCVYVLAFMNVYLHMHAMAHRSDNFLSLILLIYQVGSMDQTQAVTLLSKSFWPPRNLAKPDFTHFCHILSNGLS